jgi:DNA-binding NarL/FixJ family response regulator
MDSFRFKHGAAHTAAPSQARGPIRVMIADDYQLLREGLQAVISRAPDLQLVAIATGGEDAVNKFRATLPDVALLDVRMPGIDGLHAISMICQKHRQARLIALSTYAGEALVKRAQRAGASGYLLKSMPSEALYAAIRGVHAGGQCWPQDMLISAIFKNKDELSPRELEVVQTVAHGKSNKEIGQKLGISEETVKGYLRSILPKLGAHDRAHAVALSLQRGLLNTWDL